MTESHPVPDFWAERPAARPEPAAQPDSTAGLDPAARPGSLPRPDLPAVAKRSPAPGIAAQNTRLRNPSPHPFGPRPVPPTETMSLDGANLTQVFIFCQ